MDRDFHISDNPPEQIGPAVPIIISYGCDRMVDFVDKAKCMIEAFTTAGYPQYFLISILHP